MLGVTAAHGALNWHRRLEGVLADLVRPQADVGRARRFLRSRRQHAEAVDHMRALAAEEKPPITETLGTSPADW